MEQTDRGDRGKSAPGRGMTRGPQQLPFPRRLSLSRPHSHRGHKRLGEEGGRSWWMALRHFFQLVCLWKEISGQLLKTCILWVIFQFISHWY